MTLVMCVLYAVSDVRCMHLLACIFVCEGYQDADEAMSKMLCTKPQGYSSSAGIYHALILTCSCTNDLLKNCTHG